MLRIHIWRICLDRGNSFVCSSCRRQLSRSAIVERRLDRATSESAAVAQKLLRPSSPRWRPRSFSTSAHLNNSNSDPGPGPPKEGVFPSAFSGVGAGAWGSFATGSNRSPSSSLGDGLLPHEREARLRSAPVPVNQAETKTSIGSTGSTGYIRRDAGDQREATQGDRPRRRYNEAQSNRSRSVLADVFKTSREPQVPPTPQSWLSASRDRGPATSEAPYSSRQMARPAPISRDTPFVGASGRANDRLKNSLASENKGADWGVLSHRKPGVAHHGSPEAHKHGNESTVWDEITKKRRYLGTRPPHRTRPHAGRAGMGDQSHQAQDDVKRDFWGELETRTTSLKDRRVQNNRGDGPDAARDRPRMQRNRGDGTDAAAARAVAETHDREEGGYGHARFKPQKPDAGQYVKPRRTSRFEVTDEAPEDRHAKKSKAKDSQKSRRIAHDEDWDDEAVHRWEQKQRRKAEKEAEKQRAAEEESAAVPIFLPEYISASNLSRALKQQVDQFLRDMEEMGFENVTNDTIFTGETAALIAMEYGFEPTVDSGSLRDLQPRAAAEDASLLPSRPPVVTIMGHVDHGKTTLLDWLRKSSIAEQEHGGITQHIGAFVVKMSSGKSITFLDTPGHAAFLTMRQRGANVTDIVVLVVAADDSVKPQTLEALKHASNAKVPIIVAINKVDKADADVGQVKSDLSRHGVEIEDFGGDVQVVCVSGKTGQGMEDLEENIVTLSEVLDVRAEADGMAEGWILESSIKTQGKAATVLVKRGTLRPGDFIVAGRTWARIRALRNESGQEVDEAPPGTPVEIMGWRELPSAGEQVLQSPDEKRAKTAVEYRLEMAEREQSSIQLAEQEQRQRDKAAEEEAAAEEKRESAEPGLLLQNFTVRADVVGSVEAVCGTILEQGNNEVRPKILRSSAGPMTEFDVDHAAAANSIIVNFNCAIQPHIKQRAEEAKVQILDHNVIYHVVDDVRAALSKLLPPAVSHRVTGEADVLQVFPINVKRRVYHNIAGCRVRNGSIKKASRVKVLRRGKVIFDGNIETLKHVKKDVQETGKGSECGIGLEGFDGFEADDQIQTYVEVKEKRYL